MQYLSHSDALAFVQREAGISREIFDSNIRPRLVERSYGDRVKRFKLIAIEKAIEDPSYQEEGPSMFIKRKTVTDALEHTWTAEWSRQKGSKTQRSLVDQVKREIGDWVLKRTDYNRIEGWVFELREKKLAEATIARRLTCLLKALRVAKVKGWIDSVPEKPSISIRNERERYITQDEEALLLKACKLTGERGRIMASVLGFLLYTGCRLSELMKVRPNDISDDGVTFRDRKAGGTIKVPLTSIARQSVNELLRDQWWQHWTAKIHDRDDDLSKTALKNLKDRLTHDFRLVRDKAGVTDVSLHTCRHTCASRLVQGGYDLLKVKEWLGHKDLKMTQRYAHLAPSSLSGGAALLESRESNNIVDLDKRRILDK